MEPTRRRRTPDVPLFSSHTRIQIYRALHHPGDVWSASRKGVKIEILLTGKPDKKAVKWRARINREWAAGTAASIRDALDTISARKGTA